MITLLLCLCAVFAKKKKKDEEEEEKKLFSWKVIHLKDYDFFHATQLEKKQDKPWMILFYTPYDEVSQSLVPMMEDLAERERIAYIAACDIYENEDVRDRIQVPTYPQFIYFDMQSRMHRYTGEMTADAIYEYILDEDKPIGKKIPKSINYMKRIYRKLTGWIAVIIEIFQIIIYSIIFTIGVSIWMCNRSNHRELMKTLYKIELAQSRIQHKKKEYLKID